MEPKTRSDSRVYSRPVTEEVIYKTDEGPPARHTNSAATGIYLFMPDPNPYTLHVVTAFFRNKPAFFTNLSNHEK